MLSVVIIMSVYKNDKLQYLQEALESLYTQTKKADIYIQQDGELPLVLKAFLENEYEEGRVSYLGNRKENRGLAYSLNELLVLTLPKYEYIVRMDADDISVVNRIELQYNFLEKHKDIDIVGGYIEEFGDGLAYNKIVTYPFLHEEMFHFFSKRVPIAHVTVMYRKSFFEKAGFYPTASPTNEDTLMWMNGFQLGCRFSNISEVLVKVRVSKDFFSRRGGLLKAWSDLKDRVLVIKTLGYNSFSYFYAFALFLVNIAPAQIKQTLYRRLR